MIDRDIWIKLIGDLDQIVNLRHCLVITKDDLIFDSKEIEDVYFVQYSPTNGKEYYVDRFTNRMDRDNRFSKICELLTRIL